MKNILTVAFFIVLFFFYNCNLQYKNRISGTWYNLNIKDSGTENSEYSFYPKKVYWTNSGLGPIECYYTINKDSILFFWPQSDYKEKLKYNYFTDSIYLYFSENPLVLRKSVVQVKEKEYIFKNKTDVDSFFIKQLERTGKNYNAHFK